jgi:hypothetical protein
MARHIRTLCVTAAAATALLVGVAAPAGAAAATKVNLLKAAFGSCSSGAAGGTPTDGFAIIHANASGTLIAELSLKGLTPTATDQKVGGSNPFGRASRSRP